MHVIPRWLVGAAGASPAQPVNWHLQTRRRMKANDQDPKTWFLAQRIALHKGRLDLAAEKYHEQKEARERLRRSTSEAINQVYSALNLK